MKEKVIVTAALPYANGSIHIGHLLEYIQADIYARFLRLQGKDALYICASDMHGTPIEINAKKANMLPTEFVEMFWKEHQQDFAGFLIKFDNYYKTHSPENEELALYFFNTLREQNLIYRKKILVIYCEHCHRSLPDRLVKGECPHCQAQHQYGDVCENCSSALKGIDLVKPYCSICNNCPVKKESEHYFFKLSSFTEKLKKEFALREIQPEVKNWLEDWFKKGLEDWCISRDAPYFGFEIPNAVKETGEQKYFYVWLDAPIGYISSTKHLKKNWKEYWINGRVYQFIGKDIAYFHYLFWLALLMAVNIPLPKLTTHGFITVNREKMSKSRGTFFTAKKFLNLFPAESLRFYYASRLDQKVDDVDLNFTDFQAVNNNVLTGNLGNFCYRVLTFAEKNYGEIKEVAEEKGLRKEVLRLSKVIQADYEKMNFKSAVQNILKIADLGNAYFQKVEPWKNKEKKAEVGLGVNIAKILGILVLPILPEFGRKIKEALNMKHFALEELDFSWVGKIKEVQKLVEKIEQVPSFQKFPLKLKLGKIIEVQEHPAADKLYLLKVDFQSEVRQVVAGLKNYFSADQLLGRGAIFCVNLKPAKIRGELSQAMILVAEDGENLSFLELAGKLGEEITCGDLPNAAQEISFEDFLKLKLVVQGGRVFYEGQKLGSGSRNVLVSGVKDGARIR